jgi:5-methylcytosine-specific restriction endonuclease McrA
MDTLVLNRNYYAVHVANWEKAISLLYQGHAEAVDGDLQTYNFEDWVEFSKMIEDNPRGFVNSTTMRIAIPEVIRLTRYDKLPKIAVKFTRRNIYEHYKFRCCYCGVQHKPEDLNLDHVVPKSKGGPTTWDNIVLSCLPCNSRKGDKTPEAAGMVLRVKPSKPKWHGPKCIIVKAPAPIPVSWEKLLDRAYWDSELKD